MLNVEDERFDGPQVRHGRLSGACEHRREAELLDAPVNHGDASIADVEPRQAPIPAGGPVA